MRRARLRLSGTTLVELLVSVVFIGICVSAIVSCVTNSAARSVHAKRRILMLAQARSAIESTRSSAKSAALTTGPSVFVLNVPGFTGSATMSKNVTLLAGYTNLYRVNITINWTEKALGINRSDTLVMETLMRAPNA